MNLKDKVQESTNLKSSTTIMKKVKKQVKRNNINSISSNNSTKLLAQWSKI